MAVELNEQFLAKIAGWEVLKQARAVLAGGRVISSNWTEPVLKGVVQEGQTSYRCGLVIKDAIDIENLCTCRTAKSWGAMCVHSIAIGLHELQKKNPPAAPGTRENGSGAQKPIIPPKLQQAKVHRRIKSGEQGLSLEIGVILPPNFTEAVSKGKVMLYFEGVTARGRAPLNSLTGGETYAVEPEDAKLLEALHQIAGDTPGMFVAGTNELAQILAALQGHPRVTFGKSQEVEVLTEPLRLKMAAMLQGNGEIVLRLKETARGETVVSERHGAWNFDGASFRPVALTDALRPLMQGAVTISRAQVPLFLSQDWPRLDQSGEVEANFKLEQFELVHLAPRIVLELEGGIADLRGMLRFDYAGKIITAGAKSDSVWMPDPASPTRYGTRDPQSEQAAIARLRRAGFSGPHEDGHLQLAGQNAVLTFFARDYQKLGREWKVTLEERLQRSTEKNLERIEPNFEVTSSGEQWFDLGVTYQSGSGERFSTAEIQRLIRSGQSHTRLKNGKFAIIDTGAVEELQEVLLDCAPRQNENGYRIQNTQSGFLASALGENSGWKVAAPASWKERATQQSGQAAMNPPPLGTLEEVLRPYQKHGVGWLEFLRRNRFGGILADEMGLGKTLQTLAFLQSVAERAPSEKRQPSLIVCPTTLVFNWVAEVAKFTPKLRVVALQGPRRHELFAKLGEFDLAVTSYALVRRDSEHYAGIEFDTVVLDEAQHIKNRQTQNAQSVKSIRARNRFVLTGTPIENSVLDLWSIFDFLMPGYLGTAADFKERYEGPIARDRNPEAQARLNRRIRPFLLRRLKKEVARDLPDKIEQVSFCEMTSDQQAAYQQLLEASRQEISNAVETQGLQRSRMVILTALLRLRQICCDLRLLKLENTAANNSGKLEMFQELLQEVIDGGHRVLVFSQFVEMLSLIKEALGEQNIPFSYLDGSTTDRAKVVQEFQNDPAIPVFLISLKAGGVGLNLTAADTVIHFDPWWNPAVESQATDRAHRIGQTRVVTSYKLITRGTVEEKILSLQNKKREMIQSTLSGEETLANSLTWEEIQGLFS